MQTHDDHHHHHPAAAHDMGARPPGDHARSHHTHMVDDFRRRFWVSLALTLPVLATSEMIRHFLGLRGTLAFPGNRFVEFGFASAVYFYGGRPFLTGLVDELRKKLPGMMTLVALAITVAYVYSALVVFGLPGSVFFWETATLIDIMLLGHWIEMRSVLGASRALEQLVRLLPAEAHRVRPDGSIEEVPLDALHPGDRVLVKPGEKIPTDGLVVAGRTSVNQAMLTGESQPVERGGGDEVIGGAVNGEGAITIEVRRTGADTYLSQVIELVRKAQETRSRTQDVANRAALWLTLTAVGGGTLTLLAWLSAGRDFSFALERMVTVMVITCPHALGLAVPLVVAVSTALSARNGLLIRDRSAFERARELDAVVFDKTGTLTEGRFGVTDIVPLGAPDRRRDCAGGDGPRGAVPGSRRVRRHPGEGRPGNRGRGGGQGREPCLPQGARAGRRGPASRAAGRPGEDGRVCARRRKGNRGDRAGRHHPSRVARGAWPAQGDGHHADHAHGGLRRRGTVGRGRARAGRLLRRGAAGPEG